MNYERDQAVDAVVLMFWMSCRGIGEPVSLKITWPHCNDATLMSMSFQQVERAEPQRPVEQKLDVVHEQKPMACSVIREAFQQLGHLQVSSRARHCE